MVAVSQASSVQGVALRVTRLNSSGGLVVGDTASYVLNSFIRTTFTPEYLEGEQVTEKDVFGNTCVDKKFPDVLLSVTLELAVCYPDPEFTEIVSGGSLLSDSGFSTGYSSPSTGVNPNPNGCALEVWSRSVDSKSQSDYLPYFHWIFPYVQLRPSGDRTLENGLMANTFSGTGFGNAGFGSGPDPFDTAWNYPAVSNRPYAYARTAFAPLNSNGYFVIPAFESTDFDSNAFAV